VKPHLTTASESKLDILLHQLKNQKWHSPSLLATKLNIPQTTLEQLLQTLHQKNIIQTNPQTKWIKLNPNYTNILTEEEGEEETETTPTPHKPTLATVIIPPKQEITIQNLQLTNTTQQTLEIHIRTCKNKTQLAINELHP